MTRNVLVSGASSGIGLAVAARFAADADQVIVTARRAEPLARAAETLGARGIVCDATDPDQVAELAAQLPVRLDVLVNNAGGNTDFDRPDPADLHAYAAGWRANLDANLLSAALVTHALRDRLAVGSAVVHIGSIGAERGAGSYGAAKAALASWSIGLSAELGPRGVTSNVVSPGYIEHTEFFRDRMSDERRTSLIDATHDRRPGSVEDVVGAVHFLASAGARHVTGQVLHVNGGAFVTR
jgi:3-oxoacyl-[acyl-carrier protein] reductase